MANLASYKLDTLALLRDSKSQFTSDQMLTRYINSARREVAKRTACLQALVTGQAPFGTGAQPGNIIPGAMIPGMLPGSAANNANEPGAASTPSNQFTVLPGVELYTYQYAKPFLQGQYAGYDSIIYVFNISISWGGARPTLRWMPWDNLQAYVRSYNTGAFSYPQIWGAKGVGENGQAWVWPVPIQIPFSEMEWECVCTPRPLYTNDDFEAIPEIYQGSVKYYASRMAFLGQQRTAMAEIMSGLFEEELLIAGVASDFGHCEDYYYQLYGGY